ncbi:MULTISPECIES: helix-turn-helix transcriptional regulator [Saccharibacillus]|uniref:helix-turn-helix transcriptional regulator n=1 Tax=Saccharibacillus TaxID=456492 RepID=UPI0012383FD1|nr:AraC family transcriptional regulator [Saccharibacillus sp. WB 17]MWJ30934.1 helix-turn-helix domain-containing protein [Saccharibacillus sp. WB 17]
MAGTLGKEGGGADWADGVAEMDGSGRTDALGPTDGAAEADGTAETDGAAQADGSAEKDGWRREHTVIPDRTFPLNVFRIQESDPDMFCIPPHWHEHLEWIVVASGRFSVQVGSQLRELSAGDCAFVNAKQLHAAFPLEAGSRLHALVFGEALLRNHALDHTETRYVRPLLEGRLALRSFYAQEAAAKLRRQLLGVVSEHRAAEPGYELLVKAALLAALGLALRASARADGPGFPGAAGRGGSGRFESVRGTRSGAGADSVVYPLLLHLSERFREPIDVAAAAGLCCVTPTYFCHVFKRSTGRTLTEYVNMLRIQEAEALLRSGGHTVQEIARSVGYGDAGYFARVFRKFKNTSPGRYAEANRKAEGRG